VAAGLGQLGAGLKPQGFSGVATPEEEDGNFAGDCRISSGHGINWGLVKKEGVGRRLKIGALCARHGQVDRKREGGEKG